MMTNFKVSSKMHIFIIVSCIVIALGMAVGTICQFVAGGFFNYGADWADVKTVTVEYKYIDYSDADAVEDICIAAFDGAGIKSNKVSFVKGENNMGGTLIYEFSSSTDAEKITAAVTAIDAKIKSEGVEGSIRLSYPSESTGIALPEAGKALWHGCIAAAVIIVCGFLYFLIRYKLSTALAVLLAVVHNLALYISLTALVRVPVGSSVIAFAALVLAVTLFGSCIFFDRVRKNNKDEDLKKLSASELVDKSNVESFKVNLFVPASLSAVAVLLFILMSISSLSPLAVLSPLALALICFVCCAYGNLMFIPAVYSRFKLIADKKKNTRKVPAKKQTTDK